MGNRCVDFERERELRRRRAPEVMAQASRRDRSAVIRPPGSAPCGLSAQPERDPTLKDPTMWRYDFPINRAGRHY